MQILIVPVLVDCLHRLNIHEWKKTYFVDNMSTSDRNKKAEIALESVLMCKYKVNVKILIISTIF